MALTLENIGKYGFYPVGGTIAGYIEESIRQLASVGMNRKEIAEVMDISRSTLAVYVRKYNIPVNDSRSLPKGKLDDKTPSDFLELLNKGFNKADISVEWDCSLVTLRKWMAENGLNKRYVHYCKLATKTVEEYNELRKMMDVHEIANQWGISQKTLLKWRVENGLEVDSSKQRFRKQRKGIAH